LRLAKVRLTTTVPFLYTGIFNHVTLHFSHRKVVPRLAFATGAFSATGILVEILAKHRETHGWMALFDLDREWNFPTIYSALLLFACSGLLAMIAAERRRLPGSGALPWAALALIFCFFGLDELFSFHNSAKRLVPLWFEHNGLFDLRPDLRWVVVAIPVTLAVALLFVPFVLRLPRRTACGIVIAGTVYVGAALGLEMVGGWWIAKHNRNNWTYSVLVVAEETLEMVGTLMFLSVLLAYTERELGGRARLGALDLHLKRRRNRQPEWEHKGSAQPPAILP
jgi:hypothetical protein